jgi:hypothetical protein
MRAAVLSAVFVIMSGLCSPDASAATGRYKVDGNGGCYWDATDTGPDQCSPTSGRYKVDGAGTCYWDANDTGPDQCVPAIDQAHYDSLVNFATAVHASVSGTTPQDGEAALQLAYEYGLVPEPPGNMTPVVFAAVNGYSMRTGGTLTCPEKAKLRQRAEKAALWSYGLGGALATASAIAGAMGNVPASLILGVTAGAFGIFGASFSSLANLIGNRPCEAGGDACLMND